MSCSNNYAPSAAGKEPSCFAHSRRLLPCGLFLQLARGKKRTASAVCTQKERIPLGRFFGSSVLPVVLLALLFLRSACRPCLQNMVLVSSSPDRFLSLSSWVPAASFLQWSVLLLLAFGLSHGSVAGDPSSESPLQTQQSREDSPWHPGRQFHESEATESIFLHPRHSSTSESADDDPDEFRFFVKVRLPRPYSVEALSHPWYVSRVYPQALRPFLDNCSSPLSFDLNFCISGGSVSQFPKMGATNCPALAIASRDSAFRNKATAYSENSPFSVQPPPRWCKHAQADTSLPRRGLRQVVRFPSSAGALESASASSFSGAFSHNLLPWALGGISIFSPVCRNRGETYRQARRGVLTEPSTSLTIPPLSATRGCVSHALAPLKEEGGKAPQRVHDCSHHPRVICAESPPSQLAFPLAVYATRTWRARHRCSFQLACTRHACIYV